MSGRQKVFVKLAYPDDVFGFEVTANVVGQPRNDNYVSFGVAEFWFYPVNAWRRVPGFNLTERERYSKYGASFGDRNVLWIKIKGNTLLFGSMFCNGKDLPDALVYRKI